MTPQLKIGQRICLDGCFTEEYFLRGLTVRQIGRELGLPAYRMEKGIFIAFAIQFPTAQGFELGGWAEYSTDKFVSYSENKMKWSERDFELLYSGKRVPISIEEAKKAWLSNMRHEKLVKVLTAIRGQKDDKYPSGGKASQILVTQPIECQIVKFLKPQDVFYGVWS